MSSLHQGIGDVAPGRLEFYETWLSPAGMREGRMGLPSLGAVLSFLHREGSSTSDGVARRAGTCAADWTFEGLSRLRRDLTRRLPLWLRVRAALGLGRRLVRVTVRRSRVNVRVRRGVADVRIRSAVFDQLRDPASFPMRALYAAALARLFTLCGVDARVQVVSDAGDGWRLEVTVAGPLDIGKDAG